MPAARRTKKANPAADHLAIAFIVGAALVAVGAAAGVAGLGLYFAALAACAVMSRPKAAQVADLVTVAAAAGRMRAHLRHPFSSAMGFGPADRRMPPTRLSAWWAALAAAAAAAAPAVAAPLLPHFARQATAPPLLLVSAAGYFFVIQAQLAERRDGLGLPPATVEHSHLQVLAPKLVGAIATGLVVALAVVVALTHLPAIATMVSSGRRPFRLPALSPLAAAGIGVGVGLLAGAINATSTYLAHWSGPHRARLDLANTWMKRWSNALGPKVPPPQFAVETRLPDDAPKICTAEFVVPPRGKMDDYLAGGVVAKLAAELGTEMVLAAPTPARNDDGTTIAGQASLRSFKVEYPLETLGALPHRRTDLDKKSLEFAVNYLFRGIFAELRLGQPMLWGLSVQTTEDSPAQIVETMWKLPSNVTFEAVTKAADAIAEKAEVPWLRIGRRSTVSSSDETVSVLPIGYLSILFGDAPAGAVFQPSKLGDHGQFIEMIQWDAWFRACGLAPPSAGGVGPTVLGKRQLAANVTDFMFAFPAGLSADAITEALPALKSTSGYAYIEFHGDPNPRRFHLYAAAKDPLEATFAFREWAPAILHQAVPGVPNTEWALGVTADQQVVTMKLGDSCPHILVGGETGAGKSLALESMVLQLAVANDPKDLNFCLIDPKTALRDYAELAHVTRRVLTHPDFPFHEAAAACLDQLVDEMQKRYHAVNEAGVKDLAEAKSKGMMLDVPTMVIVMDEVSEVFNAQDKKLAEHLQSQAGRILMLGRAAGMHCVLATQYPANASAVPNHLREQLVGRIGFKTRDYIGSRNIIGFNGCEDLTKQGMGILVNGLTLVRFRGFFLDTAGEQSDQRWVLSHLPTHRPGRRFDRSGSAVEIPPAPNPSTIWAS